MSTFLARFKTFHYFCTVIPWIVSNEMLTNESMCDLFFRIDVFTTFASDWWDLGNFMWSSEGDSSGMSTIACISHDTGAPFRKKGCTMCLVSSIYLFGVGVSFHSLSPCLHGFPRTFINKDAMKGLLRQYLLNSLSLFSYFWNCLYISILNTKAYKVNYKAIKLS